MSDVDLKDLWRSDDPSGQPTVDLDAIKNEAKGFESKIKRRNVLEWIACLIVAGFYFRDALSANHMLSVFGNAFVLASAVFIAVVLWKRGRLAPQPEPNLDAMSFCRAYAANLDAQAKLLEQVHRWYLGPIAFGVICVEVGEYLAGNQSLAVVSMIGLLLAFVFGGIYWFNVRAAQKLRSQVETIRSDMQSLESMG